MYSHPKSTIYLPFSFPLLMIQKSLQSLCTPVSLYFELQLAFYFSPVEVLVTSKFWKATCAYMFTSSHSLIYDKKKKIICCTTHRLASSAQGLPRCSSFWWRGLSHSSLLLGSDRTRAVVSLEPRSAGSGPSKSSFAIKYQKLFRIKLFSHFRGDYFREQQEQNRSIYISASSTTVKALIWWILRAT